MTKEIIQIKNPKDIVRLLDKYTKKRQEHFLAITLNGAHEVIKIHVVSVGLVNRTIVHPRECFWHCIKDNAAAVAFAHNHPSNKVIPSPEDDEIHDRLLMASEILGFHMIDNFVIGKYGLYYSFREHGRFNKEYTGNEFADYAKMIAAEKEVKHEIYKN